MRPANSTLPAPPAPPNQSCQLDLVALGDRLHLAALEDQRSRLGPGNRSPRWRLADQPALERRSDRSRLVEPACSNRRLQRGDVRVRTLSRPGRTVEKNRVVGQVVRRIVPCAQPIQPFRPRRPRRTSRASWTLWPLGTGCTLRPLRTNGADWALGTGRPGGALRTSQPLSAGRTGRALLSQRAPIGAFNGGDVRVRTLSRPGRTVEKNRVVGQVVRRIVPCAQPIQPFRPRRPRRTSRASWTLWPLGTGCTLRPLRTNGTGWALGTARTGGALRTSRPLNAGRTGRALRTCGAGRPRRPLWSLETLWPCESLRPCGSSRRQRI